MAKINATWHDANPMPKNAKREQRIDWHLQHADACACSNYPRLSKAPSSWFDIAKVKPLSSEPLPMV